MVKPQSAGCQSAAAQPQPARKSVALMTQMSLIPGGDRLDAFPIRLLGAALGSKLRSGATAWVMAIATVASVSTASPAVSAGVGDWSYSPETGAIGFALESSAKPKYFLMANPMRIVVDLPGTGANLQALEAQSGGVFTAIKASKGQAGKTRLVLQLAPGTVLQPGQVELTALGGGRWSLQPLLAEGGLPEQGLSERGLSEQEFMPEGAPTVTRLPGADEPVEEPEFELPSLAVMEAAAEAEQNSEFVSMEETLARQRPQGSAPAPVAVPQGVVPVAANSVVEWGSSQLPPVPTNLAPANTATRDVAIAPVIAAPQVQAVEPAFLPQLPQPRLGQAPLAFNPPSQSSLVDPAQIVDTRPLRQSNRQARASFGARPPAAVEPVIDPKLLPLNEQLQSAASLGGQTGLVLNRKVAPAARRSAAPQSSVPQVAVPRAAAPVALPVVTPQPGAAEEAVPFLVEFGAPLPVVGQ